MKPELNRYKYHGAAPRRPIKRSRKPLPKWVAKIPYAERFYRMSKKRKVVLLAWTGGSVLVMLTLFTTVYFASTLGSKESIMNRNKTGVTLVDQNNQTFYELYNARSETYVPLDQIAPTTKEALIASEDKNFYKHHGFSPIGILNAVWQNVRPGGLDNGGSTLTQQLVKNALLTKNRSLIRKYQEIVLSVEIERRYSKDEILEMYLNSTYFGEGAFGIEDAAKTYFQKSANDLSTAEASMLVGVLPAPSAYSPITGDPAKAERRQSYVLDRMKKDGYISDTEAEAADTAPLNYAAAESTNQYQAPHFALMVKEELEKKYGEEKVARSGYRVKTTLNLDWQSRAEKAVSDQVAKLARSNVSNGSAVVLDPKTGEIRALVGSSDWDNEQFGKLNMATALRQPGSSFKPLVYATGIEDRNFSAATAWQDKATDFGGGYSPKNYDLRYHGEVTTRTALANSYNIPAVAALQKTGISSTVDQAQALGLTTLDDANSYGLSLALGAGQARLTEMTNAYASFANDGKNNQITTITSITDKNNKQIFEHKPENKQAISAQTSYIMSNMLSDNSARSSTFGSSLNLNGGRLGAVKTGTTENYRDAWTIGYTPSLAVGVWIGNNDGTLMSSVAGSSGAAPIWRNVMNDILKGSPNERFTAPTDITSRSICRSNGKLAATNDGSPTLIEYFRPGTLPTESCNEKVKAPEPVTPTTPIKPEDDEEEDEDTTSPTTPTLPLFPNNPGNSGNSGNSGGNQGNGGGNN